MARLLDVRASLTPAPAAAPAAVTAATKAPLPQAPAEAALPPGTFRVGDAAILTLAANVDGDGHVQWPTREQLQQSLGEHASVLAEGAPVKPTDALGVGHADGMAYPVQVLLPPGEGTLGPVTLSLVGADGAEIEKADAPALSVKIVTVLEPELAKKLDAQQAAAAAASGPVPTDAKAAYTSELAAPRGPWELAATWPLGWIALAAALVLAALAYLWWRRRRMRPAPPPPPPELAEVVARRRLDALESSGMLGRGEVLAFHVEIADVLKQYLSRRLDTDLLEMTTDEVKRVLRGDVASKAGSVLAAVTRAGSVRNDIIRVLTSCDLVKFARQRPAPAQSLELLGAVRHVVDITTTALPTIEAAAAVPGDAHEAAS
jgi:hypothetical protein